MEEKFDGNQPIFLQIEKRIKNQIICGQLRPGEKLPSIREFSIISKVNPNTILKALDLLEEDGFVVTDRTNGKFVVQDADFIERRKQEIVSTKIEDFFCEMDKFGIGKLELLELIKKESKNE